MRIVSLLPSATEILCAVGLRGQLVGVTHECDYPRDVASLPQVTRTKIPAHADSASIDALVRERLATEAALYSLDAVRLAELRPDLIVTQKLCDVCAVAEREVSAAIAELPARPAVVQLTPTRLGEVLDCVLQVADAADCRPVGVACREALQQRVDEVRRRAEGLAERPRVVVLEWIAPPFSAGHWTPELVEIAGGRELLGVAGQPSTTRSWEEVLAVDPEFLLIACCGFDVPRTRRDLPLLAAQPGWQDLACVRSGRVFLVDGSAYFNRPGPRLVDSLEILAHALHPELHPPPRLAAAAVRVEAA